MFGFVRSSSVNTSVELFPLTGVSAGIVAAGLVFGRAVAGWRVLPLAVSLGFLLVTWLVVARQALGEEAIWYYLLATPVAGGTAVTSLWLGQ